VIVLVLDRAIVEIRLKSFEFRGALPMSERPELD